MNKLIVICGPTATGKSELALRIAKKYNGELINADSRHVYKLLNIGTNKDDITTIANASFINEIEIHLVNIINPDEQYDLFRFQKAVFEKIEELNKKGKLPVLIGGTGLYIDSIIKKYALTESNSSKYSRDLLDSLTVSQLQEILIGSGITHLEFNQSDWNNPRRLIRTIERQGADLREQNDRPLEYIMLYPKYNWEDLKLKINDRVLEMIKKGLIQETKNILPLGFKKEDPGLQIMGYKQIVSYLSEEITLEEATELIQIAHRQYARKQRTWFESPKRNYKLNRYVPGGAIPRELDTFIN